MLEGRAKHKSVSGPAALNLLLAPRAPAGCAVLPSAWCAALFSEPHHVCLPPCCALQRPTIDEILAMPSVRDKFIHLPPELQGVATAGGAGDDRAQMQALLQARPLAACLRWRLPVVWLQTSRRVC